METSTEFSVPNKDIMAGVSLHKGCTLEMVSRGVGWGMGAQSGNKAGSLHGLSYSWLPHHAYLKQWAAVRIQWGSRMLPPQTCCLLYWMLTCHGQESTEASTPPTTRGVFRLFPHSRQRRETREPERQDLKERHGVLWLLLSPWLGGWNSAFVNC